jgi:DNA-binding HxlR family transcriptional regulator
MSRYRGVPGHRSGGIMTHKESAAGHSSWDAARIGQGIDALLQQEPDTPERTVARGRLHALVGHMAADGVRRDEPIREVLARLGDKWSPLLLLLLDAGSFRHATLRRLVGLTSADRRISQRMLTLRLRSLERDGLIRRQFIDTHPPGVLYEITPAGRGLVEQIEALMEWTRRHADEIRHAREAFAAATLRFPAEDG